MISNSIDSSTSNSSSQLLDLLAVVANPDVYAAKIAELEAKTAEHRKFVEAIGPASEIESLRARAKNDAENAEAILNAAKQEAEAILSNAKLEAVDMKSDAKAKADAMVKKAKDRELEAEAAMKAATETLALAGVKMSEAVAAKDKADAEAQIVEAERSLLEKERREVENMREAIVEKHRAFIEGL